MEIKTFFLVVLQINYFLPWSHAVTVFYLIVFLIRFQGEKIPEQFKGIYYCKANELLQIFVDLQG
jgi:hypothetical protein